MDANVGVMVEEARAEELVAFLSSIKIDGRPIRPRLTDAGFVSWWTPGTNLAYKFASSVSPGGSERPEVSTLDGAPFLLDHFGLPVTEYLESPAAITATRRDSHAVS